MMEDENQPVTDTLKNDDGSDYKKHDDGAEYKKNDGEPKVVPEVEKSLEEKAKEFYAYVVETAKHTDKRSIMLAKQRVEAKAKEFFRQVATYVNEKAVPELILTKQKIELKAKAFAAQIVQMALKINRENMIICKETVELRSRELIIKAVKTLKTTNYKRMLKKEFHQDMAQKHGKVMASMVGMFVMVSVAFHNDGGDEAAFLSGVRGRSLADGDAMPTPKSFEPAEHSLHPKWRLWEDIPEDQQVNALEELVPYFEKYGLMIGSAFTKNHIAEDQICDSVPNSPAELCLVPEMEECSFMSFGVSGTASFESNLAETMQCKGFAVDPLESKDSKLNPSVSFQNFGISKMHEPEGEKEQKTLWNTTIPAISKFLNVGYTDVLRLDCQGCEIAMMRDILKEDPSFFHHIGQISVKKQTAKAFIDTEEDLYYFGLMFPLLEEAGHHLVKSKVHAGKPKYEKGECMSEFGEWGFHCGLGADKKEKKSRSVAELLFAKEEIAYKDGAPTSVN